MHYPVSVSFHFQILVSFVAVLTKLLEKSKKPEKECTHDKHHKTTLNCHNGTVKRFVRIIRVVVYWINIKARVVYNTVIVVCNSWMMMKRTGWRWRRRIPKKVWSNRCIWSLHDWFKGAIQANEMFQIRLLSWSQGKNEKKGVELVTDRIVQYIPYVNSAYKTPRFLRLWRLTTRHLSLKKPFWINRVENRIDFWSGCNHNTTKRLESRWQGNGQWQKESIQVTTT